MTGLSYAGVFLSVMLSGTAAFFLHTRKSTHKLLLSFSGAFLFGVCMLHLLPEIFHDGEAKMGLFILAGFLLQLLLEFVTQGAEHGHVHEHVHHHGDEHLHGKIPFGLMIGLCLHAFFEGMPLGSTVVDHSTQLNLLAGIVLHNIPVSIAFTGMLLHEHLSKQKTFFLLLVFALMSPAGMLTASLAGSGAGEAAHEYSAALLAIVVGIFLHISTTILFESSESHRFNSAKFMAIISGFGIAALGMLVH